MDTQLLFNAIGHLSFVLSAAAYLMTDIVKLRAIAIASGITGLVYNATLVSGPLWLVLFWLAVFLVINASRLYSVLADRMEVALPPDHRALLVDTFPSMHSRDWLKLMKVAQWVTVHRGDIVLALGGHTDAVCVLAKGRADELRADGTEYRRGPSAMWGELSYVTDSQFDGSPCDIRIASAEATVLRLPYPALKRVTSSNERLRAALMEGFVRTAGLKHGLMSFDGSEHPDANARTDDMARHAEASRTRQQAIRGVA